MLNSKKETALLSWQPCTSLYLERPISDVEELRFVRSVLDAWSTSIPFAPIKAVGSQVTLVEATAFATYATSVTSQIETRSIQAREEPYKDQDLPTRRIALSEVDPWAIDTTPYADFQVHRTSVDVPATRSVSECSTCGATGRVTCPDCGGLREVTCSSCDGYGHTTCASCGGRGQQEETRYVSRHVTCGVCDGDGKGPLFTDSICDSCGGRGYRIKDVAETYYVPCLGCASSGKLVCHNCRGRGKVTCHGCGGAGLVVCPRCEGDRRLLHFATVEIEEAPQVGEHRFVHSALPAFQKRLHPLSNVTADSGRCGPPIPSQVGHAFRRMWATDSDASGPPVPTEVGHPLSESEGDAG